jgi:hypothetical protein
VVHGVGLWTESIQVSHTVLCCGLECELHGVELSVQSSQVSYMVLNYGLGMQVSFQYVDVGPVIRFHVLCRYCIISCWGGGHIVLSETL